MKLTFPHMGTLDMVLSDLFSRLETDFIIPPKTSVKTVNLGTKHAPEFACFPLKVTIGNLIEGLEAGADAVVMVGGIGPCRFGFYAEVQNKILRDAGYDFEMIVLEPPTTDIKDFMKKCKKIAPKKTLWQIFQAVRVGWKKAVAIDEVEKKVLKTRCFEKNFGDTTAMHKKALAVLGKAITPREIQMARDKALSVIDGAKKDFENNPLKIGIVGEFYVLLEPCINFDIERYLGQKGIYLERSVYLTDWISFSKKNPVMGLSNDEVAKAAKPYLSHFVGGEGQATVGHVVKFAEEGFDGVIQLLPFTCMPEIIAKSVLPKIHRELDIPVLTLVIDEQTGRAGIITRLEAFIDLLWSKRKKKLSIVG
ncbi:MAG TPA: CoA protein activase [Actinobacteria bacterium]|nr:CoA protein activase [Actinomycetota bacterium]